MADPKTQIEKIRAQFTRQADAYSRSAQATNEAGLRALVAFFEASPDTDRSGLAVRREDGLLRFSHTAVAIVAQREGV